MLNGEREVAWFWLLHAILLTIFVASLVQASMMCRAPHARVPDAFTNTLLYSWYHTGEVRPQALHIYLNPRPRGVCRNPIQTDCLDSAFGFEFQETSCGANA